MRQNSTPGRRRFDVEEICRILCEASRTNRSISDVCRSHKIREQTFYRWRRAYEGASASMIIELKAQKVENSRLRSKLVQQAIINKGLTTVVSTLLHARP